jgi:nicotinate-nucleotide adenylyltransferase
LFGGSFNPVHLAHLLVAQAAYEELRLDRLFFVPAAQSPFKQNAELAPAGLRLRMLRLALAGQGHWEVDEQEVRRGGVSYTIGTVRDYARRYPEAELFYLIGADHVPLLPKWREAAALADLVRFAVIPRPEMPPATLAPPYRLQGLRGFPLGVSASQIRDRVRAGLPIRWLVPPGVAEVIEQHRLYR